MKIFFFIIVASGLFFAIYHTARIRTLIQIGNQLAESAIPYEQHPENPRFRILTIGDSSVVGTGSQIPQLTVAGRLGNAFPDADIINAGVNGMRAIALLDALSAYQDTRFDLIVIHIGGNDIVRFTNLSELDSRVRNAMTLASTMTDSIILLHGGNVGSAPFFPPGTHELYKKRTAAVRKRYIQIAKDFDAVQYVDLFREGDADPYIQDPATFYAGDSFHPSSAGYGDWYKYVLMAIEKTPFYQNR